MLLRSLRVGTIPPHQYHPVPARGLHTMPCRAAECTVKRRAIAAAARMARRHRTAAPAPRPASPLRRARALAEARAESRARGVGRTRRSRAARTGSEEPAPALRGILPHPLGCGASRWRRSRRSGSYQGGIGGGTCRRARGSPVLLHGRGAGALRDLRRPIRHGQPRWGIGPSGGRSRGAPTTSGAPAPRPLFLRSSRR